MKKSEMSDAEWAEYEADRAKLQKALDGPKGDEVRSLLKDFADFPPKSGDLKD